MFRAEAIAAADQARGVPLFARQPGWRPILTWFLPSLCLGMLVLGLFSVDERIESLGVLEPEGGLLRVPAPIDGQVMQVLRQQGEQVAAGTALFVLVADAADGSSQALNRQRLHDLEEELHQAERLGREAELTEDAQDAALDTQIESLHADLASLQRQQHIDHQRLRLGEEKLPGLRKLARSGLISGLQMADQEASVLAMRGEQESRSRQVRSLQRELEQSESDRDQRPATRAAAAEQRRLHQAALREKLSEVDSRRERVVRAHVDAVLTDVMPRVGSSVQAGQTLATLALTDRPLHAVVAIPAHAPAGVGPGMQARIRLPSYPYQQFGQIEAVVQEVSGTPLDARALAESGVPASTSMPMYRVVLRLESVDDFLAQPGVVLKPGMQLQADLVLRQRRLFEWLLFPLEPIPARPLAGGP